MIEINYSADNFRGTTTEWIDARVPFAIVVDGVRGGILKNVLPATIGITAETVGLVVAIAAFGSLAAIAIYAISQRYEIEGEATATGYKFKARPKPQAVEGNH